MRRSTPSLDTRTSPSAAYRRTLKPRHIQMIAIGGAIGTGLFLGAGGRLAAAGPSLVIAYAVCGLVAFLILRALGELVLRRPDSGSFVSYAREFLGEKAGFVMGWTYWMYWAMIGVVDATAVAVYLRFFGTYLPFFADVPQWVWALCALVTVFALNLLSVKVFGELEFWFALIKVAALVVFLVVGTLFVVLGTPVAGRTPGFALLADEGGLFPNGLLPLVLVVQGVVFAYGAIELIGTAAGETANPERTMPRAINSVILRIALFYVGSVLLLSLLLPSSAYSAGESPFVTFFSSIGVEGADVVMNLVVLTAALSSLNAGFYSTGRVARSLALRGAAPAFAARVNRAGVPYGGIVITGAVALIGIVLNVFVPDHAFEIGINLTSVGLLVAWAVIVLCQLELHRRALRGEDERPPFRMPWSPWSGYAALAFLGVIALLMLLDWPTGTLTVGAAVVVVIPLLVLGWRLVRDRVRLYSAEEAAARSSGVPAQEADDAGDAETVVR
ncbi:amino acid permease [Leifsonia sp. LS1]|uniref:amino acid permease n=1 Tax=Leifsonia sp. LS1 TaxID=2828483 RepID=UPI001CFD2632|nr:amino acid permease [Leifsonia sp. LS1]